MQHIKSYMSKIEAYLKKDMPKSRDVVSAPENANLKLIANMVQGIRTAREEHVNGNK